MTEDRNALVAERDFLLDSLRQLDRDHRAGVVDDQEYVDLRDAHTVRAAMVLEKLDGGASDAPPSSDKRADWKHLDKQIYWAAGVFLFVVIAIVAVTSGATDRLIGDNGTGSIAADTNTLLARAGQQTSTGKVTDAVKTYDAVLRQDPRNTQALTYRGWLIRLAGLSDQGLASIDRAIAVDPRYPDAHFFRGFILLRDRNDPRGAIDEFNTFLANDPPAQMVPLVQQALNDAKAQAGSA